MNHFFHLTKIIGKKAIFVLTISIVTACGSSSKNTTENNALTHNIQLKYSTETNFPQGKIKVVLRGVNTEISDVESSLISKATVALDKLPSEISFTWPKNAHQKISPPVSSAEKARYYFSIFIDTNNDKSLCNDDFIQDFEKTPFKSISKKPSDSISFFVKPISDGSCIDF